VRTSTHEFNFQIELFQKGLKEDSILCCPLGSGKTLCAALLIAQFLSRRDAAKQKGKALFVTKTISLASQQVGV
jgi:ERCC4-related helicase